MAAAIQEWLAGLGGQHRQRAPYSQTFHRRLFSCHCDWDRYQRDARMLGRMHILQLPSDLLGNNGSVSFEVGSLRRMSFTDLR